MKLCTMGNKVSIKLYLNKYMFDPLTVILLKAILLSNISAIFVVTVNPIYDFIRHISVVAVNQSKLLLDIYLL